MIIAATWSGRRGPLTCPAPRRVTILPGMFCVTEAEAAAIRAAYEQGGEFSAAIELRRLFPGITDNAGLRKLPTDLGRHGTPYRLVIRFDW